MGLLFNTIQKVVSAVTTNKNLLIFLLIVVVAILVVTNINSCNATKQAKEEAMQDAQAMKNKLTVSINKNGEQQTSIIAYEGKVKDLSTYSSVLANDVSALKNRKPQVIIQTKIVYKTDTIKIPSTITDLGNGNYDENWAYTKPDSSIMLNGNSAFKVNISSGKIVVTPGLTTVNKNIFNLDLTVGVVKNTKTGFNEIIVTPKDTSVKITHLQGAILGKTTDDKRFSLSIIAGEGIGYAGGHLGVGPFVGAGISYTIFKF